MELGYLPDLGDLLNLDLQLRAGAGSVAVQSWASMTVQNLGDVRKGQEERDRLAYPI